MTPVRRRVLRDLVDVETYNGEGAYGDTYAQEVELRCDVDATRRLVRGPTGAETVAELTLRLHPRTRIEATGAEVDPVAVLTPGTRVTWLGRPGVVINAKPHTHRGKVVLVEVTVA